MKTLLLLISIFVGINSYIYVPYNNDDYYPANLKINQNNDTIVVGSGQSIYMFDLNEKMLDKKYYNSIGNISSIDIHDNGLILLGDRDHNTLHLINENLSYNRSLLINSEMGWGGNFIPNTDNIIVTGYPEINDTSYTDIFILDLNGNTLFFKRMKCVISEFQFDTKNEFLITADGFSGTYSNIYIFDYKLNLIEKFNSTIYDVFVGTEVLENNQLLLYGMGRKYVISDYKGNISLNIKFDDYIGLERIVYYNHTIFASYTYFLDSNDMEIGFNSLISGNTLKNTNIFSTEYIWTNLELQIHYKTMKRISWTLSSSGNLGPCIIIGIF